MSRRRLGEGRRSSSTPTMVGSSPTRSLELRREAHQRRAWNSMWRKPPSPPPKARVAAMLEAARAAGVTVVLEAATPLPCRRRHREMDGDEHNEVEETSSKQQKCLLALRSAASATSAAAPPSPMCTMNLLLTVRSTSMTAAETLALLCSLSLSLSLSHWGDGRGVTTRFGGAEKRSIFGARRQADK
jgi:hypothetical protein